MDTSKYFHGEELQQQSADVLSMCKYVGSHKYWSSIWFEADGENSEWPFHYENRKPIESTKYGIDFTKWWWKMH